MSKLYSGSRPVPKDPMSRSKLLKTLGSGKRKRAVGAAVAEIRQANLKNIHARVEVFDGFAEEFRSPALPIIDPEKFSEALHIQLQDLAKLAGVHRTTVSDSPTNAKLQGYLRDAVRAMSAAYEVTEDRARAIFWFRNTPIPEFTHQTAEQLVSTGKTDAVISYLQSGGAGATG
jgi:hypothetical protein